MARFHAAALLVVLPLLAAAGEPEPKRDFTDLSRLIHRMVVKQVPREHEERFGWGGTVPIPPKLPLPKLRRYVKVGDRVELPHGAWRRVKVRLLDPDKDLRIVVRDFKQVGKVYRLVVDAEVDVLCEGEWKQWQKGLLLLDENADADARLASSMVWDVAASLSFDKLTPELRIDPKIVEMSVDLKDFTVTRVGGTVTGEKVRELATNLMRDGLRDVIKATEPLIKDYANKAVAQGLKDGRGTVSVDAILKSLPREKGGEKDK